jgi:hypothetical protein
VGRWKNAEAPLEVLLRGVVGDSLAFCAQAVLTEVQIMAGAEPARVRKETKPPFPLEELRAYLERNAASMPAGFEDTAAELHKLAGDSASQDLGGNYVQLY